MPKTVKSATDAIEVLREFRAALHVQLNEEDAELWDAALKIVEKAVVVPDKALVSEYQYRCPEHGDVFRQITVTVDGKMWPMMKDEPNIEPMKCLVCDLQIPAQLYSQLEWPAYRVLRGV